VIRTFQHKGLAAFFFTGSKAGIQPAHANRLRVQLAKLDTAKDQEDMRLSGWKLHKLSTGEWSVWVNGNWRLTFRFEDGDAILVNYQDYH
jgi:proteic killer suppression protein